MNNLLVKTLAPSIFLILILSGESCIQYRDQMLFPTLNLLFFLLGDQTRTSSDVNGDGYADLGVGAIDWVADGSNDDTGRAYLYYGSSSGITTTPATTITGESANVRFGQAMVFGDLNGDGYADFIVGSMYQNSSNWWGKVHIFYGGPSGIASGNAAAADFILLSEVDSWCTFGSSLAVYDINNDGFDDLFVGSHDKGSSAKVHVFLGGPSGISGTSPKRATLADIIITGNNIGSSISFGDVNGDGHVDIAIGALMDTTNTGKAYIIHGTSTGIPGGDAAALANTIFSGETTGDELGRSVSLGDINGDGYVDIAMGAPYYNTDQGRIYIFYGSSGGMATPANIGTDADLVIDGVVGTKQGRLVAMSDVNGDGFMDLGTGCDAYDGCASVYLGSESGLITPADKSYSDIDLLGYGIGFTDLNGDGYADFIVGGPDNPGTFNVYNGSSSGTSGTPDTIVSADTADTWFASTLTPNAGPIW